MVTALKVTNYLGDELLIDPFDPESSGFLITNISGITPVKADINFTSLTTNDGGLFNSARIGTRNITLKLVYFPKPTIEETRQLSYKFFPIKKEVTLEFETETRKAAITGYVESNDISIFTKAEYSSISIICPDPYFYSTKDDEQINVDFYGTVPLFAFPFPYTQDHVPYHETISEQFVGARVVFSEVQTFSETTVNYVGDAETGMEITFRALANDIGNITIYNRETQEGMTIDANKISSYTGQAFSTGDMIFINTNRGKKTVYLIRGGNSINILNCIDRNSSWLQFRKGENKFAFSADNTAHLEVSMRSRTLYEGL